MPVQGPDISGDVLDSTLAQTSGGMPDRVAALSEPTAASTDLIGQLTDLQNQQMQLAQAKEDVPSMGQQLLSPEGILSMLGAGLGAATGDATAASAGAGLMQGFMNQSGQESAQLRASIADSEAALIKSMDAKRRQLTTMLQTQPDLFIDPDTGQSLIDPRLLGYAATGYMIPINPAVNYQLKQKTLRQNTQIEMGMNTALKGDTPEKRSMGVQIVGSAVGVEFTPEVLEAFESADDMPIWEGLLRMPGLLTGHTLAAMAHWMDNPELSIRTSPELVGMLQADMSTTAGGHKFTVDDHYLNLIAEWNQTYSMAPENYAGMDEREQIQAIFGSRPADAKLLTSKFDMDDPFGVGISAKDHADTVRSLGEWLVKLYTLNEDMPFLVERGVTKGNVWAVANDLAAEMMPLLEQMGKDNGAKSRGHAMAMITEAIAGPDANQASYAVAASEARTILDNLVAAHTKDGVFNAKTFNEAVVEFIQAGRE